MRRPSNARPEKPKQVKFEANEEMFLKKASLRTIEKLEELKKSPDIRTRPVCAKNFGFNSTLIILVDPKLSDEAIRLKFESRINHEFNKFEDMRKSRV